MDKYTVDLDKVLNDFEYSELTGHYNNSKIPASTYDYVPQTVVQNNNNSTLPSSSYNNKIKSADVKHSITNVFNSLDEYIKTDINSQCDVVVTTFNIKNDLDKTNDSELINNKTNDEVISNKTNDEVTVEIQSTTIETNDSCVNTDQLVIIESCEEEHEKEPEIVINNKNDLLLVEEIPVVVVCDNISEVPEINVNNSCRDLIETKDCEETQNTNVVTTVGFDDTFDLDESELNKYLDELDEELKKEETVEKCDESKDNTQQEIITNETNDNQVTEVVVEEKTTDVVADVKQEDVEVEEVKVEENKCSTLRPATLKLDEKREINLIGDPGSTPYNNIYITKQLPPSKKGDSDTDTSRSASPTFSDISSDCTGSTTPSTETVNEDDFINKNEVTPKTEEASSVDVQQPSTESEVVAWMETEEETTERVDCDKSDVAGGSVIDNKTSEGDSSDDVKVDNSENNGNNSEVQSSGNNGPEIWLGKQAPLWIPDSEAVSCLHCDTKFTVIKRRHHCRACGLVLCSKCCNLRYRLEYLDGEARVCLRCYEILNHDTSSTSSELSPAVGNSPNRNQPNPNNPMEYCSMVPPLQQVSSSVAQNPPTVMVPVSVLKRKGSNKARSNKSVMFCDGIRPGSDLTKLDSDFNYNESRSSTSKKQQQQQQQQEKTVAVSKANKNIPALDATTKSFIPSSDNSLPPTVTVYKSDITYTECSNNSSVVEMLKNEMLTFALQSNLHVHVKIINMDCCINKTAWCFTTEGLINVGQDEIIILLELIDNEKIVPKDVFFHINNIYNDAVKGTTVKEMGLSLHVSSNFLDSKNHAGFLYIRPTFQCLQNVIKPNETYLIGILIHRWETPWAKIFPLRLILRLGAEYRYYPSPIISSRHRDSVFVEIGHTIINLLADFRNFSYTLPQIRGLTIHMEDKNTTVAIPTNRYDQVMKSINNSSDHILAFAGNFSMKADSHLVCIQDTQGNNENSYTTHAINIHNKPRKVTGSSFIVFNGALKSSSGLTAKSSIVEDGLMIQIPADNMVQIRESLRNMKNHTIQCGCINTVSDESVSIIWTEPDTNFNVGVVSPIDDQALGGIPSIRVHNGKDYVCNSGNRLIRWTEVFILQNSEETSRNQDPIDVSKLAEGISKATCQALVKYLDLLCTNNFYKIGIRTNLHVENVSYSAGSNSVKLPPIYMKSLDNELIPVLHRITTNNLGENAIVLELIFRILNV